MVNECMLGVRPMPVPTVACKTSFRNNSLTCSLFVICLASAAFAQQAFAQAPNKAPMPPQSDLSKVQGTHPAEPPEILKQLNSALENLTARISPAVVQVLVTGYGPLSESDRGQ